MKKLVWSWAVLAFLGRIGLARADTTGSNWNMGPLFGPDELALGFSTLLIATSGVTFGIADGVYAVERSWLPPVWAGLQIALAGLPIGIAGVATVALSADGDGDLVPEGVAVTAIGGWFIAHGALSLVHYEPTPTKAPLSRATDRDARVQVMPLPGGGSVTFQSTF